MASETKDGLTLRVGTTVSINRANPVGDYYYNILAMLMTHDSLVRFDNELKPVPQLASRFTWDRKGKVWTFDLVTNATWHDGKPVTPEDVQFTFRYIAEHNLPSRWIAEMIERIEIKGRRITFRLKRPYSPFLVNAGFVVRILPRHIWEGIADPLKASEPGMAIGCGPFVLDILDRSSGTIRFRASPFYYGPRPKMKVVEYRMFKNLDVLSLALKKHEVDTYYNYASGLPSPYMHSLHDDPGLACLEAQSVGIPAVLGFNLDKPLLKRLAVRRAIALALDYRQLNASLMGGRGMIPGPGLVPPSLPYHTEFPAWEQDLQESRRILSAEGLADSHKNQGSGDRKDQKITLTLLARSDLWGDSQIVKLLAHDLEQVGIRLTVRSVDLSTWQALLNQGRYDLVLFRTTPWGMMMHAGYGTGYFDSRTKGANMCRLQDPEFFRLCDNILSEMQPARRERLYRRLQKYYAGQLPAVALCWGKNFYPYWSVWEGFQVNHLEGGLMNSFSWKDLTLHAKGR